MHIRPFFKMSEEQSLEMINPHFFGQLITCANGKIIQTFVPFMLDKDKKAIYGHIAKQNKQVDAIAAADELLVTYLGSDAYISPNWYHGAGQVPTWNYQAVEIKGSGTLLDNQGTLEVIDKLSQIHESKFADPWLISKLTDKKLNAMLNAIVGFKIDITEINGHSKMSQNKNEEDRQGVIEGLQKQTDNNSRQVADIIKQESEK